MLAALGRGLGAAVATCGPLLAANIIALTSGERATIAVAGAFLLLGVIVGAYCVVRVARAEDIAIAGKAKADRLGEILGIPDAELDDL